MQILQLDARALIFASALVAFAAPASAFDCAKATTKYEKAICADPSARAADDAMSKAYADLLAAAPDAAQRAAIANAQVAWLQDRNGLCSDAKPAELSTCLARESNTRRAFLSGESEQGPGAGAKLAPWFRFDKGGKGKTAVDMELIKFVDPKTPGERAFNAAVTKFLDEIVEPEKGEYGADHFEVTNQMRLVYASPKLISAQASISEDTGGAHPNSNIANLNLDVAANRLVKFDDLLDAASAKKVFAICFDQVKAAKKQNMGDDAPLAPDDLKELTKNIAQSTSDIAAWSFENKQAVVTYNPYEVGSYVEGVYECKLGYDALRPLVKPGFPLP